MHSSTRTCSPRGRVSEQSARHTRARAKWHRPEDRPWKRTSTSKRDCLRKNRQPRWVQPAALHFLFFFQLSVQRKRSGCQKERSKNVEAVFVTESSRITIYSSEMYRKKKRDSQTHTGQQPHSRAHIQRDAKAHAQPLTHIQKPGAYKNMY